ncbi:DUF397 domain-containing protein [Streptomyces sp. MBT53]|uniref:DUF397 domain-containing protein n=1 Tax=Streptomyces sp. MBT53 TaxID=1488384 RepID=UPI001914226D|nr:DUF397 domain-containing protein [Streptomyces sp. MBT53]MBK6019262.1 DUF397 domain-containing protein [Streptomyces sp. MBT53]
MSVGPQPVSEPVWFKSSYSGANTTECVEAAFTPAGVLVRDSKAAGGPVLAIRARAWHCLIGELGQEEPRGH